METSKEDEQYIDQLSRDLSWQIEVVVPDLQQQVEDLEQRLRELEEERDMLLKQNIAFPRLLGEFIGTLKGIVYWDIPEELKIKLQEQIK